MKVRKGLMILLSFCLIIILTVIPLNSNGQSNHGYLVGANYMTFWGTGMDIDWSSGAVYWPILGNYSSSNTTIADKHIEWALQYGIDFFFLDYGWATDLDREKMENATIEGLLMAEKVKNFNFCIFYFPDRAINSSFVNETVLLEDFSHINETYFTHSSYLRLDNRSVVILADFPKYFNKNLIAEEINNLFSNLKQTYQLYLIPAFWPDQPEYVYGVLDDSRRIYDAVALWGSTTIVEFNQTISYSKYVNKTANYFETWSNITSDFGVAFVPLICPGYNNTIYYIMGIRDWWAIVTRDPEGFREVYLLATNYSSPPYNMVLLFTWNDFKEGTSIEPTREYNFTYLEIIPEFPSAVLLPALMIMSTLIILCMKKKTKD